MARLTGLTLTGVLALAAILACTSAQPRPNGVAATPVLPTPDLGTVQDDEEADVAIAFEAEVRQVADQDPALVATLRSFAATLKGLAAREEALDRPSTRSLLGEMDQA